ncbi:MAG: hypothetical protein E7099_09840 [Mediterranea massiliensis]|nr:hypothetical protein [Mediterranea massiliensis]
MKLIIILLLSICTGFCFSQNVQIEKYYSSYYLGNKDFNNLNYTITNNEEHSLYIWLMKESSLVNDSIKVRDYFKTLKGDFGSLYQLMLDGNVIFSKASLFQTFVKILNPEESFSFIFISEDSFSKNHASSIIDSMLVIVSEETVLKQCPDLTIKDSPMINQFLYEPNSISIPWDLFISQINKK